MVILLTGATDGTRGVIVDAFLAEHPSWRHLALESFHSDVINAQVSPEFFALLIACEAAKEAMKEGLHVVISGQHASPAMLQTLKGEFASDLVAVHLGESLTAMTAYDHVIDTARTSLDSAAKLLHTIAAR